MKYDLDMIFDNLEFKYKDRIIRLMKLNHPYNDAEGRRLTSSFIEDFTVFPFAIIMNYDFIEQINLDIEFSSLLSERIDNAYAIPSVLVLSGDVLLPVKKDDEFIKYVDAVYELLEKFEK